MKPSLSSREKAARTGQGTGYMSATDRLDACTITQLEHSLIIPSFPHLYLVVGSELAGDDVLVRP
jgi:hypothetical protein